MARHAIVGSTSLQKIGEYGTIVNEEAFAYQTIIIFPPLSAAMKGEDLLWNMSCSVLDCGTPIHSYPFSVLGCMSVLNPRSVIHLRVDAPHWSRSEVNILGVRQGCQLSMPFRIIRSNDGYRFPLSSGSYFLQLTDPAGQVLSVHEVVISKVKSFVVWASGEHEPFKVQEMTW